MTQTPRVRIGSPALPNSSESRALPSPSPQLLFLLVASVPVKFVGAFGDLRRYIDRVFLVRMF